MVAMVNKEQVYTAVREMIGPHGPLAKTNKVYRWSWPDRLPVSVEARGDRWTNVWLPWGDPPQPYPEHFAEYYPANRGRNQQLSPDLLEGKPALLCRVQTSNHLRDVLNLIAKLEQSRLRLNGPQSNAGSSGDSGSHPGEDPLRLVRARRNQGPFRQGLLVAYRAKCAISGCTIVPLLEAAHIEPYSVAKNNQLDNGLLLRADLHTLFDLHLLAVEPKTLRVHLHDSVRREDYHAFHGKEASWSSVRPSDEKLAVRWRVFQEGGAILD